MKRQVDECGMSSIIETAENTKSACLFEGAQISGNVININVNPSSQSCVKKTNYKRLRVIYLDSESSQE